jgi:hypothetical protein
VFLVNFVVKTSRNTVLTEGAPKATKGMQESPLKTAGIGWGGFNKMGFGAAAFGGAVLNSSFPLLPSVRLLVCCSPKLSVFSVFSVV